MRHVVFHFTCRELALMQVPPPAQEWFLTYVVATGHECSLPSLRKRVFIIGLNSNVAEFLQGEYKLAKVCMSVAFGRSCVVQLVSHALPALPCKCQAHVGGPSKCTAHRWTHPKPGAMHDP
jgi:hypothetical protein